MSKNESIWIKASYRVGTCQGYGQGNCQSLNRYFAKISM